MLSQILCGLPNRHTFLSHIFFSVHYLSGTAPLYFSTFVTVTQGPCNVSPSFRSEHSTLLFFHFAESLMTHSRYCVV